MTSFINNYLTTPTVIPLALYIHFPWCVQKCPYCDFNSHSLTDTDPNKKLKDLPEKLYLEKLLLDVDHDLKTQPSLLKHPRPLTSIFLGGGTPSLFSPEGLSFLLSQIKQRFSFSPEIEITLEANPGTIEHGQFKAYFDIGINRISLGVQSFNPKHLKKLGRIHNDTDAEQAILEIKQAGFTNFNLDLMHGLPTQTPEEALLDLKTALRFDPTHLSWYQLTLEPNTLFFYQKPALPNDDTLEQIESLGLNLLKSFNYERYEVFAYSKKNSASLHNQNYWTFGDYLGIGAGAHGKISDPEKRTIFRTAKIKTPKNYLAKSPEALSSPEARYISESERSFEFMMNALRLSNGVPIELYTQRTFLDVSTLHPKINQLKSNGLLSQDPKRLSATPQGFKYLNTVLEQFLVSS